MYQKITISTCKRRKRKCYGS